jgi:hypothetical protein
MTTKLPITGGCACGAIRYECSAEPLFMLFCRCRDCQRATGSPFASNVWFPTETTKFVKGDPKSHVIEAHTGQPSRHDFCGECGSPIGMRADAYFEIRGFRAASFDEPSLLKPSAHVWLCSKLPWDNPFSELPSYERNIPHDELDSLATGHP